MNNYEDRYTKDGLEIPDPTPLALPVGFRRPPSIHDLIRQYIKTELSRASQEQGGETFEEADDFVTDEDEDMRSPYQLSDEQEAAGYFTEEQPAKHQPAKHQPADPPDPAGSPSTPKGA